MEKTYRPKTETIEAIQWLGDNIEDVTNFVGEDNIEIVKTSDSETPLLHLIIETEPYTRYRVPLLSYIIRKTNISFSGMTEKEFLKHYEPIPKCVCAENGECQCENCKE